MGADKGVKRKSLGEQKQTPSKKALKVESPEEALILQTPTKNLTAENVQSSGDLDMNFESDEGEASEKKDYEVTSDTDNVKTAPPKLKDINKRVPSHYTVFVGHLDFAVVSEQILEHFNQLCKVVTVNLKIKNGKNLGFGYVQLKDELSYKNALKLNHSSLGGRRINVEPARHSFQESKGMNYKKAATKLGVKTSQKLNRRKRMLMKKKKQNT